MSLRPASVRLRLILWYSLILAGTILVLSLFVFLFVKASLFGHLNRQLESDFKTVSQIWSEEPNEIPELETESSAQIFQIVRTGKLFYQTPAFQDSGLPLIGQLLSAGSPTFRSPSGARFRLKTGQIGPEVLLTMAEDEEPVRRTLRTLLTILLLSLPIALALAAFGGFVMAGRLLEPVAVIAAKAAKISAESLSARLPIENRGDEFGRLAGVINGMLARLEDAFERLKRFTADASHEMRTPLTAIRSVGEVALQEDLDVGAYRDRIGSMLEETERLTHLLESLLLLTRSDGGRLPVKRVVQDPSKTAEKAVEDMRVIAEAKGQHLTAKLQRGILSAFDEDTVRRALVNILDNAIKYTPPGGSISVNLKGSRSFFVIEVADTGSGIPAEHRDKVFDRFYRIDDNRSRQTGGAGLGLAIAKWAVELNGGRIELESGENGGSTFRIVIPSSLDDFKE
jgi:heavy metal sensor kinase